MKPVLIATTPEHVIIEADFDSLVAFFEDAGITRAEVHYKLLSCAGGIAQYDTTQVTGYDLNRGDEHVGMMLRWRDGLWSAVVRQEALSDVSFATGVVVP